MAQGEGTEFKYQYPQKTKTNKINTGKRITTANDILKKKFRRFQDGG
jgi:hypothetical protein